ncbi:MAG TPA: DUF4175 family protein [Rubricoccaceae bacterium]|nr:DUF4175 family protein [Rubricoccaceae bacterium]
MSEASYQLLLTLRRRLRVAMRRRTAADVAFGGVVTLGVLAAVLLVGAAAEALLWMGIGLRSLFFWSFVLAALGLLGWFVAVPVLRLLGVVPGLDERHAARLAGAHHPDVADRLTALLDLADGRASAAPSPLLDGAMQMLGRQVAPVPFERVADLRPARRAAPWAAAPTLGLVVFFFAAPGPFTGAVGRLFAPGSFFAPPAPYALSVEPGDVELARGQALDVRATPTGRAIPPDAILEVGRLGEDHVEEVRLLRGPDGAYAHRLADVRASLRYRIVTEEVTTPWFEARVVPRPLVQALQVTVVPPGHTGLRARRLAPGVGDVLGLPGTTIQVQVQVGGPELDAAGLVVEWGDGRAQSVPLGRRGAGLGGAFVLRGPGTWRIRLRSRDGYENAEPVRYTLGVLQDAPPQIALLDGADGALSTRPRPRLRFRINDDYGFSGLALYWRLVPEGGQAARQFRGVALPLQGRALDQEVPYEWALDRAGHAFRPGDAVEFFGAVRDNGGKSARTPVFTLRFPSLPEQYERLDQAHDSTEAQVERMRDEAREARERFEELRDELRRDQSVDWEDQRQVERLLQQQERLSEGAEQLSEQMQDLLEEMRSGDLVSEETLRQMEAVQQAMEELDSPELREALERLREAMEGLDLREMMQQLENFEFDEREFQERLERALELIERLQTARQLDEAARRAEDLARQEQELREDTRALDRPTENREGENEEGEQREGGTPPNERASGPAERERLAREQEQAREEMQELERLLEELQRQMEEQRGAPEEQMEQLRQELQQQGLPQQMQQNASQLRQNQLGPAQQGQQQMQQQLQQLSQQLGQMASQMRGDQQARDMAGLRRALEDVLTLSREQERLGDASAALPSRSPALRPIAQQQVELSSGLTRVADSLQALARSVPQLGIAVQQTTGDALREMGQATERLAEQQAAPASGHQKAAMTHLNDLALLLSEALDQMANGGGGGGSGMPSLQQMGGQQQQLNDAIQQMLNDVAGQRLSRSASERLQQMGAQQEAIRQQLQQLLSSPEGRGLDAATRSALRRAAEEMEDAARELQRGAVSRETPVRQERILSRLLDADRSVNRRGREERREGETARPAERPERPPALPNAATPAERLRRDLLRALDSGYAPDFQELIRRYFEQLQRRSG